MTVHLLGIRHHGPGSARSVLVALEELRPSVVLIECPADCTSALEWINATTAGDRLEPPVALLGSVAADPRRAAFIPFARFSPEWQAVVWAGAHGVPVEAVDLPLTVSLAAHERCDPARPALRDPLAALAAAAGESDAERWWEDVIEHRGDGAPAFEAVAEAMAEMRVDASVSGHDLRREAHMRKRIRAAVRAGHDPVAVVCGAWHTPALDLSAAATPSAGADAATLRGLAKTTVSVSWVPWSHGRLSSASGYGAGVSCPGWYDHVFAHPGPDGVNRFLVDAARALRRADITASPDHLIATSRLAGALAALRGRPRPGLDEVLDAADSVMGNRSLIRRELVVGAAIGSVPSSAPQAPLARDLARRQRAARLRPESPATTIEVDLRTPGGLRRSHLLHQLVALGVPWGVRDRGRPGAGTFRETWRLSWHPELSVRCIELSAYGPTVSDAAAARLVERAEQATTVTEVSAALETALLGSLTESVGPIVATLENRAATEPDLGDLMGAVPSLAQAQRYGDVRSTDVSALAVVIDGLVVRILAGLPAACSSLDDAAAAAMAERLGEMHRALAVIDHPARRAGLPDVVEVLAGSAGHGTVRGRATRLLHDGGRWSSADVEQRLARELSARAAPSAGAAFVEGFLAGGGTVLVHDAELLAVLDRWLSSLRPEAFDETVPLLRRTFGSFEPAERRRLGRLIAGDDPDVVAGVGPGFDDHRAAEVMRTVRCMIGLPT